MDSIGASGRLSTRQLRKSGGVPPVTARTPLPSCLAGICLLVSWWGPPGPPSSCPLKVGAPGPPPFSLHDPRQSDPPFCLDVQQLFQTQYTELLTFPSVSPHLRRWELQALGSAVPSPAHSVTRPALSSRSVWDLSPSLRSTATTPAKATELCHMGSTGLQGPPLDPPAALPLPSVTNVGGKDPVKWESGDCVPDAAVASPCADETGNPAWQAQPGPCRQSCGGSVSTAAGTPVRSRGCAPQTEVSCPLRSTRK